MLTLPRAVRSKRPLAREKFYVPGSLLQVRVDPASPLAWGMAETADVMFSASPTYRLASQAKSAETETTTEGNGPHEPSASPIAVQKIAWFDSKSPLRSGWAWGQEHLEGGIAIAEAEIGAGRLVLYGPQILFRAQPHGTFKFFFNGIIQAGMEE